jgi:hypothetical protein
MHSPAEPTRSIRRPLFIGTSGGAGCNIAVEAIARNMQAEGNTECIEYQASLVQDKKFDWHGVGLWAASGLMQNVPLLSPLVRSATNALHHPVLPSPRELEQEILAIEAGQKDARGQAKKRVYVDMLLDVFDSGYLYVAIYNALHKRFLIKQAGYMVAQQTSFEKRQYKHVKNYFSKQLENAHRQGTPYTEIVTTQMVSLDAISDAVLEYNQRHGTTIQVHQYMSDIFTEGAQHYVLPLRHLNAKQRSVLVLHGINIIKDQHLLGNLETAPFAGIEEIPLDNNPMIRQGFQSLPEFSLDHAEELLLPVQQSSGNDLQIPIQPGEKIATVMLSSLGCDDSVEYARHLAVLTEQGYSKLFVFCGKNIGLKNKLSLLIKELDGRKKCLGTPNPSEIIILDQQDAPHIANLLTRSDLSVSRGGMIIMEEMSLTHHSEQKFFFHHLRNNEGQLTTGLPWEDESINHFLQFVQEKDKVTWAKKGTLDDFFNEINGTSIDPVARIQLELERYLHAFSSEQSFFHEKELNDALILLIKEIQQDIDQQLKKKVALSSIYHSPACRIALQSLSFINQFVHSASVVSSAPNVEAHKQTKLLELIHNFDKQIYDIAHPSRLAKSIAFLISAAIGFTCGLIIGGIIGMLVGIWTGPGAIFTALAGLTSGAVTGAAIGLTAVATVSGATTAILAWNKHSFFKPTPIEHASKQLVDEMEASLKLS